MRKILIFVGVLLASSPAWAGHRRYFTDASDINSGILGNARLDPSSVTLQGNSSIPNFMLDKTSVTMLGSGINLTSTETRRIMIPGDLYTSSVPLNRIPFSGGILMNGGSTWTVTNIQMYTAFASTTCSTIGFIAQSSGTPNSTGVRISPNLEVTTGAVGGAAGNNFSVYTSTSWVVNANSILTVNLERANVLSSGVPCGGTPSSDAVFVIKFDNPAGTP